MQIILQGAFDTSQSLRRPTLRKGEDKKASLCLLLPGVNAGADALGEAFGVAAGRFLAVGRDQLVQCREQRHLRQ